MLNLTNFVTLGMIISCSRELFSMQLIMIGYERPNANGRFLSSELEILLSIKMLTKCQY